jgi:hypothetical protein
MTLQRLIVTFKGEEIVLHTLYGTQDGPGPNTKGRRRQVAELAKNGLRQVLASIESEADTELVGCSGFVQREGIGYELH